MIIVVTGGGSGGHITPILAVAHELKKLHPESKIVYIGQTGDPFAEVPKTDPNIDEVHTVSAGKFRRYYGEGFKQLLDLKTMYLNFRDLFRIVRGFFQSRRLMRKLDPIVVFTRGGYVSVPVAMAGKTRGIPFITHDSDAIPSLANRLIARYAARNTVALPAEIYPYDQHKTVTVGVPVMADYVHVTPELQQSYRSDLGYAQDDDIVFVIGGGQGAQRINDAILLGAVELFERFPRLRLLHVAGHANQVDIQERYAAALSVENLQRVTVFGYLNGVYKYSGASNVVVTRAGASSIADFGVQGKACIIIPSPVLVGGHQLKNAAYLQEQQAAEFVDERKMTANPALLTEAISELLANGERQKLLGDTLTKYGHKNSALELATLLMEVAKK